jgi:mono/diheme cytochrome c family protein
MNGFFQRCGGLVVGVALALVLLAAGCDSSAARFHSNLVQMAAGNVSAKHQQQIADILEAMYGTPDQPQLPPDTGLDLRRIEIAAGPVEGYTRGLFRLHCVHCHGITGDGMGPTAFFLKPYPRDYRQGMYKFKSTTSNNPPTHTDLVRTLTEGVTGTAMPSFKLLPSKDIDALVEYVEYLSLRGQTELALIEQYKLADAFDPDKQDFPTTRDFLLDTVLKPIVDKWQGAASKVTQVTKPPEDFGTQASIDAGRQVFYDQAKAKGGCVKCHGPTALGDGQLVLDDWNKAIDDLTKKAAGGDLPELSHALAVDSLPARESQPRNLRQGIFRGGRQPYEIFYRLSNGINGANMPGIAQTPDMTSDDIWHVIDFVLDLPYQPGSQFHTEERMTAPPRERL